MKALVYHGPAQKSWRTPEARDHRTLTDSTVTKTTICGTDLHILKGDLPSCVPVASSGTRASGCRQRWGGRHRIQDCDRVLISCVSACGKCEYCRKGMFSHCTTGGWILGNTIDGTRPSSSASTCRHQPLPDPEGADEEALVMLSDILPTGFECGVLNGKVQPGATIAIVVSGPIGLAACSPPSSIRRRRSS